MQKYTIYRYLGTNGVVETPVHLEGIYYVKLFHLVASDGKILTDGEQLKRVVNVPEEEFNQWYEIDNPTGQN